MNMGLIGAIGGAGKGFESYITEEQQFARTQKLENLRASNNQATNKQNNEQRQSNDKAMASIRKENDISLEALRNTNTIAANSQRDSAINDRATSSERNLQTLIDSGMDPAEARDRVFPVGGRTGSSDLDMTRDRNKFIQQRLGDGLDLDSAEVEAERVFGQSQRQSPDQAGGKKMEFPQPSQRHTQGMQSALQSAGTAEERQAIMQQWEQKFGIPFQATGVSDWDSDRPSL